MQSQRVSGTNSSKVVYYYHCKYPGCHYKTIRSGHLKRHERTHTKEKPYKCQFCSYTAARSDHLRRHMKIHLKKLNAASCSALHDSDSTLSMSDSTLSVSASSSPVVSPSPSLSTSSSPLQPLQEASSPVSFTPLGPSYYDEGVFINFLRHCYMNQRA